MLDGTPIDENKIYTGITLEFLLKGGDDFIKAFGVYKDPDTGVETVPLPISNIQDMGEQREVFEAELKKIGKVRK